MEALGLGSTATQAEIKKAYHKQAREHHPDKGGEELKFKQISNAYAYLSDSSPKPDAPIQSDTRQQGSSNTNSPPLFCDNYDCRLTTIRTAGFYSYC